MINTKDLIRSLSVELANHPKRSSFNHGKAKILFQSAMRELFTEKNEVNARQYALEGFGCLINDIDNEGLLPELSHPGNGEVIYASFIN